MTVAVWCSCKFKVHLSLLIFDKLKIGLRLKMSLKIPSTCRIQNMSKTEIRSVLGRFTFYNNSISMLQSVISLCYPQNRLQTIRSKNVKLFLLFISTSTLLLPLPQLLILRFFNFLFLLILPPARHQISFSLHRRVFAYFTQNDGIAFIQQNMRQQTE